MDAELSQDGRADRLAKNVSEKLKISKNCAQTSFSVLQEEFDLDGEAILKALTPFPGIALRGETCGAVTGSISMTPLNVPRSSVSGAAAHLPRAWFG